MAAASAGAAEAAFAAKPRKERTSMCSYCGMTFNKKEHLQRHERTHTLDRPYHCDFSGCGKSFARRDTLTRHIRLHQRDEVQGTLKIPLGHAEDDETSEDFTTPSGSKQVSPARSGSAAPPAASAAILAGGKGKKATHSRTGSIASQKGNKRASGSKGASQPNSKKNTPEYKTAAEDGIRPLITPSAPVRSRPRRAAAAALYDENALMDEEISSSEQDELQDDSETEHDHMVIPNEVKPDLHQVNSALAPHVVIGHQQDSAKVEDMITPLLPSLHTSSYLARSLEAQQAQGAPNVKSAQSHPAAGAAVAGVTQPIYNFASWDQAMNYPGGNQQNPTLVANSNNPNLLGYSSSANSSSSSGSAYNSSHSQLGSGGSASLASPYSFNGSNQTQGTTGSALGLDLGLPLSPAVPILPTPQEVQHFHGFNFPGDSRTDSNGGAAGNQQRQQQGGIPPYSTGQQQPAYETFPSFQGPNLSYHHQRANSTASAAAAGGKFYNTNNGSSTTAAAGSQGHTNQSSSSTAAQSFLASGTSGAYSPHLSQRDSSTLLSTSAPSGTPAALSSFSASSAPALSGTFGSKTAASGGYKKKAPSFVPSFWAHMTVQHQEPPASPTAPLPLSHQQYQQSLYAHMQHHRSATTSSFSPTEDGLELLSNYSDTSSLVSAPSSLFSITSPTLTTSMNLYSLTSPTGEVSNLPSLSSSFSSTFSGDFFNDASTDSGDGNSAFKYRGSCMEPFLSLDGTDQTMRGVQSDLNAAILKAADAHTDQFINWPERESSPCTFPGLSPENAYSASSVNYAHSPASATSYLDFRDYDTAVTQSASKSSLFCGGS